MDATTCFECNNMESSVRKKCNQSGPRLQQCAEGFLRGERPEVEEGAKKGLRKRKFGQFLLNRPSLGKTFSPCFPALRTESLT